MKIKRGFITNSSSTCFIVHLPEDISSDEERQRYFGLKEIEAKYLCIGMERGKTREELVDELLHGRCDELEQIRVENGILESCEELNELTDNDRELIQLGAYVPHYIINGINYKLDYVLALDRIPADHDWGSAREEFKNRVRPYAERLVDRLIFNHHLENLVIIEVGDENATGSFLEHDWRFKDIPHLAMNRH